MTKEIQLIGGCFDCKICKISDETFHRGYLEIYEPLPEDYDLMSGCVDLRVLIYYKSPTDKFKWEIKV